MPDSPIDPAAAPAASSLLRRARSGGTSAMLLGTLASAVGAYLFQVVGGRALGADAFAPVSVMWTVLFLGLTIFLLPVEQLVIRRLTLARGSADALDGSWRIIVGVVAAATILAIGFAVFARNGLLEGDAGYLPVAAVMFPSHGLFIVGRGFLAGRRRFNAYGIVVALDTVGKLAGAVVVAVAGMGAVALSWALVLSPVLVLVVRPFRQEAEVGDTAEAIGAGSDRRFLGSYLVATAASQTVLAAGPLVVGALGATPAAISVFFVTTTLFRGPMSASYNLVARFLPAFTHLAAEGEDAELNHWARRIAIGGAVGAALAYAIAAAVGPGIVSLLYTSEFRPSATLAGLAAAAVIAGMVGLATTQILVARGATDRMAVVWLIALVAAAVAIVVVPSDPEIRVAAGFLVGEAVALFGLTAAALVRAPRYSTRGVNTAATASSTTTGTGASVWRRRLFLAMVFLLPLHTVFLRGWIAWRPFLLLVVVIVLLDAADGVRERSWPWHGRASVALAVFLTAVAASWPGSVHAGRFARLLLALCVGGAVMLVVERGLRVPGADREVLRVVFWSGAAMAFTGIVLAFASTGSLGSATMGFLDDLPLVDRFSKPAYLTDGFVAVTNWHQDPGYAAAWTNLWASLGLVAATAGLGSRWRRLDIVILGGLGFATMMTMSRTGWMGMVAGLGITALLLAWRRGADRIDLLLRLGAAGLVALALLGVLWATDPAGVGGDVSRQFSFRLDQGLSLGTVEGAGDPLGTDDGPADVRGEVWPRYVDAFTGNPLRGIGLGTGWETPGMQEPHNLALELLGETGLLGLAGFLVLAWVVLRRGSGIVGTIALVVALLPAVTQTVLFEPTWWFAAGLMLGGIRFVGSRADPVVPT